MFQIKKSKVQRRVSSKILRLQPQVHMTLDFHNLFLVLGKGALLQPSVHRPVAQCKTEFAHSLSLQFKSIPRDGV
jgi:hypothetical protein